MDMVFQIYDYPPKENGPAATWGQRHLGYLKQYRKVTYTTFSQAENATLILPTLTDRRRNALKGSLRTWNRHKA